MMFFVWLRKKIIHFTHPSQSVYVSPSFFCVKERNKKKQKEQKKSILVQLGPRILRTRWSQNSEEWAVLVLFFWWSF